MNSMFSRRMSLLAAGAAVTASLLVSSAHAVVVHRYTFNGNAEDVVGTADGTVVDVGSTTAAYLNGYLMLSGNSGQGSNGITEDAYVNLPNGIVTAAANGGTAGAVSFEYWFTVATQRTWQRIGDFGTADGPDDAIKTDGEDVSNEGAQSDYLMMTPNSGNFGNGLAMTNHNDLGQEPGAGIAGPFPVGKESHVVAVYDKNDTSGGTRPGGTMTLYLDGVQRAQAAIAPEFTIADDGNAATNELIDNNNWLGRSQWNDPVFDGLYNEFAIYNHAVTAAEVSANFTAGPVGGKSGPVATVNRDTGSIVLTNVGAGVNVTGYQLTSATGTLQPENHNKISERLDVLGNGSFDSDDLWQAYLVTPASPTTLEEAMQPSGSGDGGQLTGTTSITLNTGANRLWRKYHVEDVRMMLQVQVGTQILDLPANVVYTGNGGVKWVRSDLNFDNAINAADYEIFRSNHRKPIDAMTFPTDPQSYVFGDIDGDQDNDFADFRLFQADYIAANGEAAFAALLASVPEPSGAVLAALGMALAARRRGRKR
jgi:hypothetical protein